MPYANTEAMQVFLDHFAATIGDDEHVAMVLDQAGWHGSARCACPTTSRCCRCRPTRPSSIPVERVWLHLKERFLSHRLHRRLRCNRRRRLQSMEPPRAEAGRITSLCSYPWILKVKP